MTSVSLIYILLPVHYRFRQFYVSCVTVKKCETNFFFVFLKDYKYFFYTLDWPFISAVNDHMTFNVETMRNLVKVIYNKMNICEMLECDRLQLLIQISPSFHYCKIYLNGMKIYLQANLILNIKFWRLTMPNKEIIVCFIKFQNTFVLTEKIRNVSRKYSTQNHRDQTWDVLQF